ncbi:phage distal tail protein [Salibacterium lacus]|uniref:Siphovirus-type tail component C-terminal domain-containing protein n=1 Tax=Salibacterium lacus TaxID=1898109 RepID=A0ABW5SWQ1_9BACI
MKKRIEYIPPHGGSVIFGTFTPFRLMETEGFGNTRLSEQVQRSPYQVGESLLGVRADSRVLTMRVKVIGNNTKELDEWKNELSRTLAMDPTTALNDVQTGLLRYYRQNLATVELPVIPRDSPQYSDETHRISEADIEFYSPHPYWRETQDTFIEMMESGGFEFPMNMPLEMSTFNLQQEIENQGDIPVHPFFRIYGSVTQPRLMNLTTDEMIEISGSVAEGEYVEIQTGFGRKRIEIVQNGTRENAMNRLNINNSTFFQLQRGINTIRFEADQNTSGRALVYWRARYGGV